jgi:hypothetical protein
MPVQRGVCPECGHMTTWFQIRLFGGCAGILAALIGLAVLWFNALFGNG